MSTPAHKDLSNRLLAWYDEHRRDLPWRVGPGEISDPYRVWLSEIMLQQTTVAAVKPYFERFLQRWPTIQDMASASLDDILKGWAGLGYYARARNLHKCATLVADQYGGLFPDSEAGLIELPGIGRYTAAAIAAIVYGRRATVVDGNVERVMARLHGVDEPLPAAKPLLYAHAEAQTPENRCGDYAQAVMDLGATLCSPSRPSCELCPWSAPCRAKATGQTDVLPRRQKKKPRPTRYGTAFWLERDGTSGPEVLLRRRPEQGLLGGMMEIPSTPWAEDSAGDLAEGRDESAPAPVAPAPVEWHEVPGTVVHVFTHFRLELDVKRGVLRDGFDVPGSWTQVDRLGEEALPSVMRKVVEKCAGSRARR